MEYFAGEEGWSIRVYMDREGELFHCEYLGYFDVFIVTCRFGIAQWNPDTLCKMIAVGAWERIE